MRFLLLTFLAVLSWFAGLVIYLLALRIIYGQSISSGDLEAVVLWSGITSVIAMPLVYVPVMFVTRYLLNGVNPVAVFPLAGILVSVIPIILLGVLLGGLDLGGLDLEGAVQAPRQIPLDAALAALKPLLEDPGVLR